MPYPPGLTDPAHRAAFCYVFIAYTRLLDLHHGFIPAVDNITYAPGNTVVNEANSVNIGRAENQVISWEASRVWKGYGYTTTLRGVAVVPWMKSTNFRSLAHKRIRELKTGLTRYSKDVQWQEAM
jgi:hypothetical protein